MLECMKRLLTFTFAFRFLTKNRDPFPKDLADVLTASSNELVLEIFNDGFAKRIGTPKDKDRALTLKRKASSKAMLTLVEQVCWNDSLRLCCLSLISPSPFRL